MDSKLESIAMQLSEEEIKQLVKIKKMTDKKNIGLFRQRDRLAAQLAKVEAEIAKRLGTGAAEGAPAPKRRGRKPKSAVAAEAGAAPKPRRGRKPGRRRVNFSAAVRSIFEKAGEPLRARQVVELLAADGMKVKDELEMRKRVSVVLAQHKKFFEQVERGVYRLK